MMTGRNQFLVILRGILLLLLLILLYIAVFPAWPREPIGSNVKVNHKVIESDSTLEEQWFRSDISSTGEMVATKGLLFIVSSPEYKVLAFNGSNGTLLWNTSDKNLVSSLYATSSALYVGSLGQAIIAHDLLTGKILWSSRLPFRNVTGLYVVDNLIYARSPFNVYYLLRADTGEVIQTFTQQPTAATVQAMQIQSGTLTETLQIKPEYFQSAAFTEDTMFVWTEPGVIRAIDRGTGKTLWEPKEKVVGNVAATKSMVYLLTIYGKLLGLSSRSGEVISSVKFEPGQFRPIDPQVYRIGYGVAVDKDTGLLYALLGDSNQLFAFKIMNPPDN